MCKKYIYMCKKYIYGGRGVQPHFLAHGKIVSFPIFPHGKKWEKKYMEREGNEYFSFFFHIIFFPFFPMGKNGKRHIFPMGKNGVGPPIYNIYIYIYIYIYVKKYIYIIYVKNANGYF